MSDKMLNFADPSGIQTVSGLLSNLMTRASVFWDWWEFLWSLP
ncbi:hypothetical protein N826_36485 [Skermanella aerolata KACC 11604]|nr:hypothetical protein N826_36485 [Skermanella aerolata KACC 11604]